MQPSPHGKGRLVSYQYFQAFITGRRVLELGRGDAVSTTWLIERAARVTTQDLCLELGSLPLEDDLADVVLVPELGDWVGWSPLLTELTRVLAPEGVVLLSVPSGDLIPGEGLTFEELGSLLEAGFAEVRLLGQIPFRGFTVADFQPGEEQLEPALDCSLVDEDQPPHRYLALASAMPLEPQPYEVIQVPSGGAEGADRESPEALRARLDRERARAETERLRAQAAERALGEAQASAQQRARRADTAERRGDSLMSRLEQGAAELVGLHQRLADVQAQAQADRWRVDELSGLAQQLQQQLDERGEPEEQEGRAAGQLEELKRALQEAEARVAEQSRRATNAEARLATRSSRAEEASPDPLPEVQEPASPDLQDQMSALKEGAAVHDEQMDDLQLKVRELQAYNNELKREAEETTQDQDEQSIQLVEARADNRRLRQENAKLARKLAAALGELQKIKRENRTEG